MPTKEEAKKALDLIIQKSRAHLYKPIQIAEILYHDRTDGDINLLNIEDYRTKSKKWRDNISRELLGRVCSSSARFQDALFLDTSMPPILLNELGIENRRVAGVVEAYIYQQVFNRHGQLTAALEYCLQATKDTFDIKQFIDSFWYSPGLKRSLDKVYEIVVYSVFSTLVTTVNLQVAVSVDYEKIEILSDFEDFAKMVMCIDFSNPSYVQDARVFRVGVTNAADRGLDMYANWGPAIQVKHLSLDVELAEDIVSNVSSDRVIIVCKDAEKDVIVSLLSQIGWRSHIQSIITESNLITWYEKALRGKYAEVMGDKLLSCLCNEIAQEFPLTENIPDALKNRHYTQISDPFWR